MTRYDVAVDDYLHQIVRTRPWIKQEDEARLMAFGEWLEGQPAAGLEEITRPLIDAYVHDAGLEQAEEQAFYMALQRLYTWSEWQGLVPADTIGLSTR